MKLNKGFLVAIEGIDGCGKSTLTAALGEHFKDAIITREPGGTSLGMLIREIIEKKLNICPETQFLLFAADRAQHIKEVINPSLQQNKLVITDRFIDSSIVYQGYAQGLDKRIINKISTLIYRSELYLPNNPEGDLKIYLRIDAKSAIDRLNKRDKAFTSFESVHKHLQLLIDGYEDLYGDDYFIRTGDECGAVIIDALLPQEEIAKIAIKAIEDLIK